MIIPPIPPEANVVMVRHGESTWNAVHRWQGTADAPLSEHGLAEARQAAATLHSWRSHGWAAIDAVATSSLQRARVTGAIIADRLEVPVVAAESAFDERYAGEWQGMLRDDIVAQYPGWLESSDRRPDGWESDDVLVARAVPALEALVADRPGLQLLVVSHGGLIHAVERAASPRADEFRRIANLSGACFEVAPDALRLVGDRIDLA